MTGAIGPCPGCGLAVGRKACQDTFDDVALRVRALAWTDSLKTWRLMHDVYNIQHPDDFCQSYKGLIMHLGGVGWAIEHGGVERGYRALQQLAQRPGWEDEPFPPAPGIPAERGTINVSRLAALTEPLVLVSGIDRWARSTWVAYAALQPAARDWIQQALLLVPDRKP